MSRFALFAVLAVVVAALMLTGDPAPARLAATDMGAVLRAPARLVSDHEHGRAPSPSGSTGEPLWRRLVEGSAAHRAEGAGAAGEPPIELWVQGYRIDLSLSADQDVRLHARTFESIVRELRAIGAEQGFEFTVRERNTPDFPGVNFFASYDDGSLALEAALPDGSTFAASRPWSAPDRRSVLPAMLAILVAVLLRSPLWALGCGVLVAAGLAAVQRGAEGAPALVREVATGLPVELVASVLAPGRLPILGFLVAMLAMISVMRAAGGMHGLLEIFARVATNARRSQVATYLLGMVVFFDHYANTVLVGATMRPLCDRFRVAREKLAWIVDSTAAPVAGLSLFSTWIAFEVSAFAPHLPDAGLGATQGYEVFLRSLPYRFYSLLTLFLVAIVVVSGRDFGPMLQAERRARTGALTRVGAKLLGDRGAAEADPEGGRGRARAALLPLSAFLVVTLSATLVRGFAAPGLAPDLASWGAALRGALLAGCGAEPLFLGALAGLALAVHEAFAAGRGRAVLGAAWRGSAAVRPVLALLLLAWTFGALQSGIGTATYLSVRLQEGPNPLTLPMILFALAALIAFATGSSWSTMTILLPLVVGLAYEAGPSTPLGAVGLVLVAIGAVLEGAIFGDHCSPIADSTVMSSIATRCDHVDHVRTQAPYALLVMVATLACGYFPAVFLGLSPLACLGLGAAFLSGFLCLYGRRADERGAQAPSAEERSERSADPAPGAGSRAA